MCNFCEEENNEFLSDEDMLRILGIPEDPETIEGDYEERFQQVYKFWQDTQTNPPVTDNFK